MLKMISMTARTSDLFSKSRKIFRMRTPKLCNGLKERAKLQYSLCDVNGKTKIQRI